MSKEIPQEVVAQPESQEDISWKDAIEDVPPQKQILHEPTMSESTAPPGEKECASLENELANLRFILDIPLQVTVELGRRRLLVHDLLQLHQGSVIELTKQIGEPCDVLVNHKLIARGEIVVINDKFGVRITDIISPIERVQQLQ